MKLPNSYDTPDTSELDELREEIKELKAQISDAKTYLDRRTDPEVPETCPYIDDVKEAITAMLDATEELGSGTQIWDDLNDCKDTLETIRGFNADLRSASYDNYQHCSDAENALV